MEGDGMLKDKESLKKLFVGGIPHSVSDDEFKEYFRTFGELKDSVIIRDKDTKPRGFGFVTFTTYQDLNTVLQNRPHRFESKEVEVKRAIPREHSSPTAHMRCKKLFVGGLPKDADEEQFRATLNSHYEHCGLGSVTKIDFIKDKETNKNRGFGFLEVDTEDLADLIVIYDNTPTINGKKVEIKKAEEKGNKGGNAPRGGGRGGGHAPRGGGGGGYGNTHGGGGGGGFNGYSAYGSAPDYGGSMSYDGSSQYGGGYSQGYGYANPQGSGRGGSIGYQGFYGSTGGYPESDMQQSDFRGAASYRQGGGGYGSTRGRPGNERYRPY